jgi:hypothetical protein
MTATRHRTARLTAIGELETAQSQLWDIDRRRYAADDAVWGLIAGGRCSEHEYLTAKLDFAHTHMVARDIAARAAIAAVEASRPPKVEAERTRDLLIRVLHDYGWHHSSFESTVRFVRDRYEESRRAEPERDARRSRAPSAAAALARAGSKPPVGSLHPPSRRQPAAGR